MSVADPALPGYLWLVVVGALGAFIFGFGTGANDVANAFGTSVGARTLTLKQAVVIAAIFEFGGSLLLGRVSTNVIAGGIADINAFTREPEMYAYGMMIALLVSGVWNILASYWELNVSATHSIIGSIMGFSLVYAGGSAVLWAERQPGAFPPYGGIVPIIVCWFFAPVATGLLSALMFFVIRFCILRRKNGVMLTCIMLPILVFLTVFICLFFVLTKGAKKMISDSDSSWNDSKALWISAASAGGALVLGAVTMVPWVLYRLRQKYNDDGTEIVQEVPQDTEAGKVKVEQDAGEEDFSSAPNPKLAHLMSSMKKSFIKSKDLMMHGMEVDVHELVEEDEMVAEIHRNAEVFDPRVEYCFAFLQVFSAVCVTFSHGAGEVGYMAGPLATIWNLYTEGQLVKAVEAPIWIILISALGLVVGLATYGYKVTRGVGVRMAKLSPSRGFCAELATAGLILLASQYSLPTSSSQCITGGIIGVGLLEGMKGVNWKFFAKQFSSWVATLFVVGAITAAFFAQGIYAPSKISGAAQIKYENQMTQLTTSLYSNYNKTLQPFITANSSIPVLGSRPDLDNQYVQLQKAITKASADAKFLTGTKQQTVRPEVVYNALLDALALYQASTVMAVGQEAVFPNATACNNAAGSQAACAAPQLVPKDTGLTVKAPGL